MRIFGREPTLWIAVIGSVLSLVAGFGFDWLTADQAALFIAVLNAGLGVANAMLVRPIAPAAFTYGVAAVAALAVGYGLDVTQEQIASVNFVVLAVLGLATRGQVSPTASSHPVFSRD